MNGHNIVTNESLALSMVLVLIAGQLSGKTGAGKRCYLNYLAGDRAADNRRLCAEIYL
ncbi:hypothetical protein MJ563_06855 [Klebsiella pneumoniae]|nr:hypothetical protein MJ563_06855 [Klebsiella pneumoniae]